MKQSQLYLIKIWCTVVVMAPVASTLLLIKNIARLTIQEILLIMALSIIVGFIYFLVDVLIACLVLGITKPKVNVALGCMFGLLVLQLLVLYKYNLSFIYKGAGITCLCYIIIFLAAAWLCKPKPIVDIA